MEFEEYMSSLTEQIHDKRAKSLVAKEIRNHIEEQTEMYESDGMEHEEALKEAVRQMGNPVETGMELNKIHKPKMPWTMLFLVMAMMLASLITQAVIFAEGAQMHKNWGNLLAGTIGSNMVGFAIILLLLYLDYNFIARHAYKFYAAFIVGLPLYLLVSEVGNIWIAPVFTSYYGLQMLFPILFAGIIYKNRNRGWKGIGICMALGVFEIVWYGICYGAFGRYSYSYYPAMAESLIIMSAILGFAVWKGIFGRNQKKQISYFLVCIGCVLLVGSLILACSGGMRDYLWHRILNIFVETDSSYMNELLKNSIHDASWLGGQNFLMGTPNTETYTTFALNSVFTYFGKIAGVVVIAIYMAFLGMALKISLKQSNRIGFLIGTACTVSILVRFAAYLAINTGCALWWTTLVPFFSYGKVSALMNGIYIGLILCVYRNSNILQEENTAQKRLPRIRVTIE